MYKLNFSNAFREDIGAATKYIRETLQSPVAAEELKSEVKKAYKTLKEFPLGYPAVRDDYLATLGFRSVIVKNYMLFFIVEPKLNEIFIVRFLYGRRDWRYILSNAEVL